MSLPKDESELLNWMVSCYYEYAKRFSVFVPEDQPKPAVWHPAISPPDEKGKLSAKVIKKWVWFDETREFLRERYDGFGILNTPSLVFDCLVPKFHTRMDIDDNDDWYADAIQMKVTGGEIAFSCSSRKCMRNFCRMNRRNSKRIAADIFGLLAEFENKGDLSALSIVAKGFKLKLKSFKSSGTRETNILRYEVDKQAIHNLLKTYKNMRVQHLTSFLTEARDLIARSKLVKWHSRKFHADKAYFSQDIIGNIYRIRTAAAKAYLWLLIHQEELARNTHSPGMKVSDKELSDALGVSKTTATTYRKLLVEKRLVETEEKITGKNKEIYITKAKYSIPSTTLR